MCFELGIMGITRGGVGLVGWVTDMQAKHKAWAREEVGGPLDVSRQSSFTSKLGGAGGQGRAITQPVSRAKKTPCTCKARRLLARRLLMFLPLLPCPWLVVAWGGMVCHEVA